MKTKITELLGIKYPIIQGGMAWTSDANLAAAVSNAGGAAADNIAVMAAGVKFIKSVNAKAAVMRCQFFHALLHGFKVLVACACFFIAQRKIQMLRSDTKRVLQGKILKTGIPQRTAHTRRAAEKICFVQRVYGKQTCKRISCKPAPQNAVQSCFCLR